MTSTYRKYFWEAEASPLGDGEWLVRSEGGERCVFDGLEKGAAEEIAKTHNWEIERVSAGERSRCVEIAKRLGGCPTQGERDEGFNAACELVAKKIAHESSEVRGPKP